MTLNADPALNGSMDVSISNTSSINTNSANLRLELIASFTVTNKILDLLYYSPNKFPNSIEQKLTPEEYNYHDRT